MREIVNGLSVPNDMSSYLLAGGKMKRGDRSDTKKCSLTSIRLETLASDNNESSSSFTWKKITNKYKAWRQVEEAKPPRAREEHLSVYQFVCKKWNKNGPTVPQFFGFHDYPHWPIQDEYSKFNLFLHKPWSKKPEEVKGEYTTYREALWEYCQEPDTRFPKCKYAEILRAKRGDKAVDESEGTTVTGHLEHTPTSDR